MITQITGRLDALNPDAATIHIGLPGGITLELLVPAYAIHRLNGRMGDTVTLSTLTFLESQNQGSTFIPRLAGFTSPHDRAFFELFVTVKGIGNRKALKALAIPAHQIAEAIDQRDTKTLQTLPEIGKRMAETIVVTLQDKVTPYLQLIDPSLNTHAAGLTDNDSTSSSNADPEVITGELDEQTTQAINNSALAREALEVLTQLGENRIQAMTWIDRILYPQRHSTPESPSNNTPESSPPTDVQSLITEVYRLKAGN